MSQITLFQKQYVAWEYLHDESTTEIVYGGGAGGGKTVLGCNWIATEIVAKPGSTWFLARSELKKLKLSTLVSFFRALKELGFSEKGYKYNQQDGVIDFKNGCKVVLLDLAYSPSDPEFDRLGSLEFTGGFIDEAQEIADKAREIITSRIRNLKGNGWEAEPKLFMSCNPGKNFIYTQFYKPWKKQQLEPHRAFIQSLPTDNPHLAKSYIQNLKRMDKISRERLLYGNFDYDDDPTKLFEIHELAEMYNGVNYSNKKHYITCDVARLGADNTVIIVWKGLTAIKIEVIKKNRLDELSNRLKAIALEYNIPMERVIVDESGVGGGVVDILSCRGFVSNSSPLQPYSSKLLPYMKRNYVNIKTQAFFYLQKYVLEHKIKISIPNEYHEIITEELLFVKQVDVDNDAKIKLEPKADMKARLGRSPDYADCIAMRMWFEIKAHFEGLEDELTQDQLEEEGMNPIMLAIEEEIEKQKQQSKHPELDLDVYD